MIHPIILISLCNEEIFAPLVRLSHIISQWRVRHKMCHLTFSYLVDRPISWSKYHLVDYDEDNERFLRGEGRDSFDICGLLAVFCGTKSAFPH